MVFTVPKPFKVKATGTIDYQFFVIDAGFTEDKWIQAAEVKPSCRAVVHHVLVFVQPPSEPLVLNARHLQYQGAAVAGVAARGGGGPRGEGAGGAGPRGDGPATRWRTRRWWPRSGGVTVTAALSANG